VTDDYTNYTIRLRESKRDEWKEAVDDSDQYNSVSQLIRHSVDQQIGRIEDETEGMTKEQKEIIDQIEAENGRIRSLIEQVREGVEELQETSLSVSEAEAIAHQQTQTVIQEFHHEEGGEE